VRGHRPLLALLLIGLGIAFLLRNFGLLPSPPPDLGRWWPVLLLGIGLFLLVRGLGGTDRADSVVPGTVLAIYGAFFLLIPLGVMGPGEVGRYWGIFPGAIGVALIVRHLVSPGSRARLLVPATVLLLVGVLGLAGNVLHASWRLWPVVLIAVGLVLLLRRRG
jgi:hypothetical protein